MFSKLKRGRPSFADVEKAEKEIEVVLDAVKGRPEEERVKAIMAGCPECDNIKNLIAAKHALQTQGIKWLRKIGGWKQRRRRGPKKNEDNEDMIERYFKEGTQ